MKKTTIEQTLLVAALALGLAASASAQSTQAPPEPEPGTIQSLPAGLVGTNYTELSFGYLKGDTTPRLFHDYELLVNQAVERDGSFGIDANFTYDYLTGGYEGYHDYRNEALLGATAYLNEGWGKPFVTADAGWAIQQAADKVGDSFAYEFAGGVEFDPTGRLALTPFVQYEAEPRIRQGDPSLADLPNYAFDCGAKATFRLTREWSASLTADLDLHSASDYGLRAGFSYRY